MRMTKSRARKRMAVILVVFISPILVKAIWVMCATSGHGSFDTERKEIIHRTNYLTSKAIGCATSLNDMEFRNQLLKTAEIAGSTVTCFGKSHYLLANVALVGEAIALAMRTSAPQTSLKN
jgi:hypothetical protein